MINYLQGELYRLFRKKSSYIYYGVLAVLFYLLVFLASSDTTPDNFINQSGIALFSLFPVFIGIQVFLSVYSDDFNSKAIINSASCGINKPTIVLDKIVLSIIYMFIIYVFLFVVYAIAFIFLFGLSDLSLLLNLLPGGYVSFAVTIGFISLGSLIVLATQKSIGALIVYILLATSLFIQILFLLANVPFLNFIQDLLPYSLTMQSSSLYSTIDSFSDIPLKFNLVVLGYIVVSLIINMIVFSKKDIQTN